jgi:hypothetical protein
MLRVLVRATAFARGTWTDYTRNMRGIEIVQKKGTKSYYKIRDFLNTLPFKVEEYQDSHFFVYSEDLPKYLIQFGRLCTEMRIPRIIANAPRKQIKLFLKWYYEYRNH